MAWTTFMDMHSGGGQKEDFAYLYVEAPETEARSIFYHRFGHNPERVTCTCCGDDYSISEDRSLEQATAYQRNCRYGYFRSDGAECSRGEAWKPGRGMSRGCTSGYVEEADPERAYAGPYIPLEAYLAQDGVAVIRASEISDDERKGEVPEQGYVWAD